MVAGKGIVVHNAKLPRKNRHPWPLTIMNEVNPVVHLVRINDDSLWLPGGPCVPWMCHWIRVKLHNKGYQPKIDRESNKARVSPGGRSLQIRGRR